MWALIVALTLAAAQEVPMSCEDRVLGTVRPTMGLVTRIGNPTVADIAGGWPNPYFGEVDFGIEDNREVSDSNGVRYIEPVLTTPNFQGQYLHRYWIDTGENSEPEAGQTFWNLTGNALYFRLVPMDNAPSPGSTGTPDDQWRTTMQLYDFDDFSVVLIEILGHEGGHTMDFTIFDDTVDEATTDVPYDPEQHHWFRVRHEESGNLIHLETAPVGCGSWTTHLTAGPMVSRIDQYTIEFTWSVNSTESYPSTIGYVGPLNQQPVSHEMGLITRIKEVQKVLGPVRKTLDLFTNVGGV